MGSLMVIVDSAASWRYGYQGQSSAGVIPAPLESLGLRVADCLTLPAGIVRAEVPQLPQHVLVDDPA